MEVDLLSLLRSHPALTVFLLIAFGYVVGEIRIAGVQLGASTGVLLGGLAAGHFGLGGSQGAESIGFMLFIYCVGLQAGPQFFSVFREQGAKYVALALLVAVSGAVLAVLAAGRLGLGAGYPAGLLAGSLTSTPTLVAAQDAVRGGAAALPAGVTAAAAVENVTVAYAVTYVFGLVGLVLLVALLPRAFGIDVAAEAKRAGRGDGAERPPSRASKPIVRVYRATADTFLGAGLDELRFLDRTGCVVQRIRRGGVLLDVEPTSRLERDDLVAVMGPLRRQAAIAETLGPEAIDEELLDQVPETRTVIVSRAEAVGRRVSELGITERHGCFLTRLGRAGVALPLELDVRLQKGDTLTVTGDKRGLDPLTAELGQAERAGNETDLVTFALGMSAGILLGTVSVKVGALSLGVGTAGGLLFAGLVVGFLRSLNPTFGRVPAAASYVLMELGLLFFMANVGLAAGAGIVEALAEAGFRLVFSGMVITTVPVLLGFLFGRFVLRLDAATLLGAITGAMTSTPALGVVTRVAQSPVPTLGYAGTYAVANVILAVAGGLMMRL